jgi:hypothetical protein
MEYIADAVPYEGSEWWRIASCEVPVSTLHALYRQSGEVICFGVERKPPDRELDKRIASELLSAIDAQLLGGGFLGDHGITPCRLSGFDSLGHLSGSERRFTNGWSNGPGWSNDMRVVHVFPCFACELSAAWPTPRFATVVREFAVFDLSRKPSPYLEIKMLGGKSKFLVKKWSWESLTLTLTYARILAQEPEGVLEVRNLQGDVAVFSRTDGWRDYEERITAHALLTGSSQ